MSAPISAGGREMRRRHGWTAWGNEIAAAMKEDVT
jgi:hypothetical protein